MEAERLERSRRRVLGLIAFPAEHAHDDLGELAGRGDGLLAAARDDGFGDRAGPPLLAELADDLGKLLLGQCVDDIGCGRALPAHAHIERSLFHEGETALSLVELHRRDAKIEHDAGDGADRLMCRDVLHFAEARVDRDQSPGISLDKSRTHAKRLWVAVDGDDFAVGRLQDGFGVAPCPERAVDDDLAVFRLKRLKHLREHHGNVAGRSAGGRRSSAATRHHSRAPSGPPLPRRPAPSSLRRSRTFWRASDKWDSNRLGSHIWNFSPSPTKVM